MNSISYLSANGWAYSYDRPERVWRATKDGKEINQYHKSELLWVLDHIDELPNIEQYCTLQKVPPL